MAKLTLTKSPVTPTPTKRTNHPTTLTALTSDHRTKLTAVLAPMLDGGTPDQVTIRATILPGFRTWGHPTADDYRRLADALLKPHGLKRIGRVITTPTWTVHYTVAPITTPTK